MTERPLVSIVVPTYREAENLPRLVEEISSAMRESRYGFEIIIVDDDSRDGSIESVERLIREGHPVRIEVRTDPRDLSRAALHGFRSAAGKYLVCMDADLSHPASSIPQFIDTLALEEADFVVGSRYVQGGSTEERWGLFRRLNSGVATLLARPLVRVKDPMSGFFAFPAEILKEVTRLDPVGYKILLELLVRARARRIIELPIHFAQRQKGESKLTLRQQMLYLRHLVRLYSFALFRRTTR